MRIAYNIFIWFYGIAVTLAAFSNKKAKQWVDGRKDIFSRLKQSGIKGEAIIWVHCASLGEFEQGRPVVEKLKEVYPEHKILITFFSPSGYEVRKNYKEADYIFYLPLDTPKNARNFLNIVRPQMALFVKYEFWYNYINELHRQKIPLIHISVNFRSSQIFFKPWGQWFRKQLMKITWIFVQNEKSLDLLDRIKIHHADVSGDTRFDRVADLPGEKMDSITLDSFRNNSLTLIGGSTWKPGEKMICSFLKKNHETIKIILAPHLVDDGHIKEIVSLFEKYNPVLFSKIKQYDDNNIIPKEIKDKLILSRVMIIDTIGLLSHIYRYGDIAYIGGGFGVGIHNVLEAAIYELPVIFGPNHRKFNEAIAIKELGSGFSVNNEQEFIDIAKRLITDETFRKESGINANTFVKKNSGATHLIINKVKEYIIAG